MTPSRTIKFWLWLALIVLGAMLVARVFATDPNVLLDQTKQALLTPKPDPAFLRSSQVAPSDGLPPFPSDATMEDEIVYIPPPPLVITNTVSFDTTLRITNGGLTKYILVRSWPDKTEVARVKVPEPTGLRAIMGKKTSGTNVYWVPVGWSNLTQTISVRFTNIGPVGLFQLGGGN